MKRKITSAEVTIVALCKRGANTLRTLYKSAGGARLMAMVKAADTFQEKGELLAVVAVPGLDFSPDGDGTVDVIESPEAVEKSMNAFMRNGAQLDLRHNLLPLSKDKAYVAQNFIIQPNDPRFAGWKDYAGKEVDVTGGWGMLVKIEDPALRKSFASGEWDGVSLFAPDFTSEPLHKTDDTDLTRAIRATLEAAGLVKTRTESTAEESDMTPEQIDALSKSIVDGLTAALKPAPKDEPKPDAPIAFEGELTPENLRKHQAKVRRAALVKAGDLNDAAKIEALIKEIEADPKAEREALRKSNPTMAAALDERDALEKRIKDLEKGSNQSAGGTDTPTPGVGEAALVASARGVAAMLNKERGYAVKA